MARPGSSIGKLKLWQLSDKMIATTDYYTIAALDGLEALVARHYTQPFPWHMHDAFTISLVTHGTELIQLPETTLYAPAGSLSILNPHEVHATPLLHPTGYSFSTFYVSPEVMTNLAGGQPVHFSQRVIQHSTLYAHFWHLQHLVPRAGLPFEHAFTRGVRCLIAQYGGAVGTKEPIATEEIRALQHLLTERLLTPPPLAQLARQYGLSKFQLVRLFKQQTGLTPQGFVLLQRIEAAKQLLRQGSPLVEAALAVGFYDQAHFCRFFKRFVGVSPGRYQTSE